MNAVTGAAAAGEKIPSFRQSAAVLPKMSELGISRRQQLRGIGGSDALTNLNGLKGHAATGDPKHTHEPVSASLPEHTARLS